MPSSVITIIDHREVRVDYDRKQRTIILMAPNLDADLPHEVSIGQTQAKRIAQQIIGGLESVASNLPFENTNPAPQSPETLPFSQDRRGATGRGAVDVISYVGGRYSTNIIAHREVRVFHDREQRTVIVVSPNPNSDHPHEVRMGETQAQEIAHRILECLAFVEDYFQPTSVD